MTLQFPNVSRSFDAARDCVRFSGYDHTREVAFFIAGDAIRGVDGGHHAPLGCAVVDVESGERGMPRATAAPASRDSGRSTSLPSSSCPMSRRFRIIWCMRHAAAFDRRTDFQDLEQQIRRVEVRDSEFAKTTTQKIKRHLVHHETPPA